MEALRGRTGLKHNDSRASSYVRSFTLRGRNCVKHGRRFPAYSQALEPCSTAFTGQWFQELATYLGTGRGLHLLL